MVPREMSLNLKPETQYSAHAGRTLLETPFIEIENAVTFPAKIRNLWVRRAQRKGILFCLNTAHSVYFDTPGLDMWRNGYSARVRRGGSAKAVCRGGITIDEEVFPHQFALKNRNREFQAAAREAARGLHPDREDYGVYPYIRDETEGEHHWPHNATELRFSDLPYSKLRHDGRDIGNIIKGLIEAGKIEGISDKDDLVLIPTVTTTVQRQFAKFYFDPREPLDFITHWPAPRPTPDMKEKDRYLCIEVALDKCVQRKPPPGMSIDRVITAASNDFGTFSNLGSTSPFEYELKAEKSGRRLTDLQAIDGFTRFGIALLNYVNNLSSRAAFTQCASSVQPMASKATMAMGALPECRTGGKNRVTYLAGLPIAP